MKKLTICLVVGLILSVSVPAMAITTMTFEEFLGSDGALIGSIYSGITFTAASTGQDWIASDILNGAYNASSWPSGAGGGQYWVYDWVSAWTGVLGDDGRIDFDNGDATFVELGYSAYNSSGGTAIHLDAYDSGGTLIDTDSGVSNLRYVDGNASGPGTLRVDGTNIAYVVIHDTGNSWIVDNISTDATGIRGVIPAPGAILLGSIGVSFVGWLRRRRTL